MATQRGALNTPVTNNNLNAIAMEIARRGITLSSLLMGFREWFLFRVATLGFDFFILIFMMLLLIVAALAMGGHVRLMQASVILPALVAVAAIAIRVRRSGADWKSEAGLILRDWVPFVIIVFIFIIFIWFCCSF